MKRFLACAICALAMTGVEAADFFSTEKCDEMFTFGTRIGFNTSNRTMGDNCFPNGYHHESWGMGFNIGFVASLNVRDYLSIQPGFFFETRSGAYTIMGTAHDNGLTDDGSHIAQAGKRSSSNFTIPVIAVFNFNIADNVRWSVEAGPYVSFVLSSDLKNKAFVVDGISTEPLFMQKPAAVDFGIKMGTGIEVRRHYYIGAHYMAGCINAWKELDINNLTKKFGGITKGWVFTLGYNF